MTLVADELLGYVRTGGLGTGASFLALALARMGHRVEVLYIGAAMKRPMDPEWRRVYEDSDVQIRHLARSVERVEPNFFGQMRDTELALRAATPEVVVTHPCAPQDNLALIDQMVTLFGAIAGVAERGAELRLAIERELALTHAADRPAQDVLYLIWREPWMTVARDTYISRMLAQVNWHTLPALAGGEHGAARYPTVNGDEPWLAKVQQVLLSSEPYAFGQQHVALAQALCPNARVRIVDGELISWYGPRAIAGLRYLRALAA